MAHDDAWWWVTSGLGLMLGGVLLLRLDDPFLLTMWGICLLLSGCTTTIVGTGVLLRLWR